MICKPGSFNLIPPRNALGVVSSNPVFRESSLNWSRNRETIRALSVRLTAANAHSKDGLKISAQSRWRLFGDTTDRSAHSLIRHDAATAPGGERSLYSGAVWARHRLTAVWATVVRARREECKEACGGS